MAGTVATQGQELTTQPVTYYNNPAPEAQPVRTGSWGTPELGVTEAVGDFFGQSRNAQGGSQLSQGTMLFGNGDTPYVSNNVAPTSSSYKYTQLGGSGTPPPTQTNNNPPPSNNSNTKPNPQTTYLTINGETKKLSDWMGEGILDEYGNVIQKGKPTGPSQIDIDNAYGEANSFYDQMLNQANSGKQTFLDAYTQPYDALKPGYEQALTTGTNMLNQQKSDVGLQTQNALAAARKLYNDLTQGIRQRFGGSSSAGEFANEFQGRELQNQMGNVRNTEGQNMQQINMKQTELQNQYQANLKELELQKTAALSKATDAFNQRIQAITEAKGQLAQQKAAAKINELQNYRALASQIQSQAQQAAQQLQMQLLSGQQALAQTIAQSQTYAGQPVNLSAVPQQYAQMLGGQSYNPSAFATSLTGNVGGTRRDLYGT